MFALGAGPAVYSLGADERVLAVAPSPGSGAFLAVWTTKYLHICTTGASLESISRLDARSVGDGESDLALVVWQLPAAAAGSAAAAQPHEHGNREHRIALVSRSQVVVVQFTEVLEKKSWVGWILGEEDQEEDERDPYRRPLSYEMSHRISVTAAAGAQYTAACATTAGGLMVGRDDGVIAALSWEGEAGPEARVADCLSAVEVGGEGLGQEPLHPVHLAAAGAVLLLACSSGGVYCLDLTSGGSGGPLELQPSSCRVLVPVMIGCVSPPCTALSAIVGAPVGTHAMVLGAVGRADGRVEVFQLLQATTLAAGGGPTAPWIVRLATVIGAPGGSDDDNGPEVDHNHRNGRGSSAVTGLAWRPAPQAPGTDAPSAGAAVLGVHCGGGALGAGADRVLVWSLDPEHPAKGPSTGVDTPAAAPAVGEPVHHAWGRWKESQLLAPLLSHVAALPHAPGAPGGGARGQLLAWTARGFSLLVGLPGGWASGVGAPMPKGSAEEEKPVPRTAHIARIQFADAASATASQLTLGRCSTSRSLSEAGAFLLCSEGLLGLAPSGGWSSGAVEEGASLCWRPLPASQHYVPANAPLRGSSASADGSAVAVCGDRGVCVYDARRDAWHVFSTPRQEQGVCPVLMTWLGNRVLLVLHAVGGEDGGRGAAGTPQPGSGSGAARGPGASPRATPRTASPRPPVAPTATAPRPSVPAPAPSPPPPALFELQAYSRTRLDAETRLGGLRVSLPHGSHPIALATGTSVVHLSPTADGEPGAGGDDPSPSTTPGSAVAHWLVLAYSTEAKGQSTDAKGQQLNVALFRLQLGTASAPLDHTSMPAAAATAPALPPASKASAGGSLAVAAIQNTPRDRSSAPPSPRAPSTASVAPPASAPIPIVPGAPIRCSGSSAPAAAPAPCCPPFASPADVVSAVAARRRETRDHNTHEAVVASGGGGDEDGAGGSGGGGYAASAIPGWASKLPQHQPPGDSSAPAPSASTGGVPHGVPSGQPTAPQVRGISLSPQGQLSLIIDAADAAVGTTTAAGGGAHGAAVWAAGHGGAAATGRGSGPRSGAPQPPSPAPHLQPLTGVSLTLVSVFAAPLTLLSPTANEGEPESGSLTTLGVLGAHVAVEDDEVAAPVSGAPATAAAALQPSLADSYWAGEGGALGALPSAAPSRRASVGSYAPRSSPSAWLQLAPQLLLTTGSGTPFILDLCTGRLHALKLGRGLFDPNSRVTFAAALPASTWGGSPSVVLALMTTQGASFVYTPAFAPLPRGAPGGAGAAAAALMGTQQDSTGGSSTPAKPSAALFSNSGSGSSTAVGFLVSCRPLPLSGGGGAVGKDAGAALILGVLPRRHGALVTAHPRTATLPAPSSLLSPALTPESPAQGSGGGKSAPRSSSSSNGGGMPRGSRPSSAAPSTGRGSWASGAGEGASPSSPRPTALPLLPPGVRVVPTLHLVLKAAIMSALYGAPAPGSGSSSGDPDDLDPLASATALAAAAMASKSSLVHAALRLLLHDAIEDEPAAVASSVSGAQGASSPKGRQGVPGERVQARLALVRRHTAASSAPAFLSPLRRGVSSESSGSGGGVLPPDSGAPTAASALAGLQLELQEGLLVPLAAGVAPGALSLLRALAEALKAYLARKRLPLGAVFGPGIAALAAQQQLEGLRASGAGAVAPGSQESAPGTPSGRRGAVGDPAFWGPGPSTPSHGSSSSSPAPPAPCSPYLECVFSLLRRLDVFLDVVSAVGRTIEEERLPQLFPAAGHPRALFRDALRRAAQASGSVSSTPIHNRGSLRFLRNAAALMLLVQEFAWRQQQPRGGPDPRGTGPTAPHSPPPSAIRAIVNTNLGDASSLLVSCGIPADVAAMLVGPLLGGSNHNSNINSIPRVQPFDGPGAPGLPSLLSDILATVVAEDAPATLRGLVAIVDSTLAYCRRLRAAAEEHLLSAAAAGSTAAPAAIAPASTVGGSSGGGGGGGLFSGGGLLGGLAGLLGLGGSRAAPSPGTPSGSGLTPSYRDSEEQAAILQALQSDPILQSLTQCHVPLLASFRLRLHRKPDPSGAFGLVLAPVNHTLAVRGGGRLESAADTQQLLQAGGGGTTAAPTRTRASGASGLWGRKADAPAPLSGDEDALAVGVALGELVDQQHAWLGAQIRDSEACIGGLVAPLTSAVAASGPAPPALAIGDILTRTDATPLAGLPFEEVVRSLGAAPRSAVLELLRIVDVPVIEVLGLLLLALRQQQE